MTEEEIIDEICKISSFLGGYGPVAEIAAERLRRLCDRIEGVAEDVEEDQ